MYSMSLFLKVKQLQEFLHQNGKKMVIDNCFRLSSHYQLIPIALSLTEFKACLLQKELLLSP